VIWDFGHGWTRTHPDKIKAFLIRVNLMLLDSLSLEQLNHTPLPTGEPPPTDDELSAPGGKYEDRNQR
jgi:hypothetical protein